MGANTNQAVTGFCLQSEPLAPCVVGAGDRATVLALAGAVTADVEWLPGVNGEIAVASVFAAEWAAARHVAVRPEFVDRLYRREADTPAPALDSGQPPIGTLRPATMADLELLVTWAVAFQHDAFGPGPVDRAELTDVMVHKVEARLAWLWQVDGSPVAMAAATPTVAAVTRIQHVYTPPEHRGRGHAAGVVSGVVVERAAAGATTSVLYADLANPTSNAVYRRIGFVPVSEHVNYTFG